MWKLKELFFGGVGQSDMESKVSSLRTMFPLRMKVVIAITFVGAVLFSTFAMPLSVRAQREHATIYPVATTVERNRARRQNNSDRVSAIEEEIERAARSVQFSPPNAGAPGAEVAQPPVPPSSWFDELWKLIANIVNRVFRALFTWLASYVVTLIHNPNIASPYDGPSNSYTASNGQVIPYDIVGRNVKAGVREGFAVMRALAINLLLLLFILAIWKSWTEAAWKNGQALMGTVGRLITTAGLILFWPVISYHVVQISNEMIDYVFRSISPVNVEIALRRVSDMAASGATALLFGQSVRFLGGLGNIIANGGTRIVGWFLCFIFFGVAIYECTYLIVLKAVQTGLMMAQFMFAPMFLVFFAIPDTERIAAGYIKSCIEVSLWTFIWAGLLRLLTVVLSSGEDNMWGQFIMLLGILQIMMQVPSFLAHAQISPVSEFLSPRSLLGGFSALWKTLGEGKEQFMKWADSFGSDSTKLKDRDSSSTSDPSGKTLNTAQGAHVTTGSNSGEAPVAKRKGAGLPDSAQNAAAANAAAGGVGVSQQQAGNQGLNKAGANAKGKTRHKPVEDPIAALASQIDRGQIGEADADTSSIEHDGERGVVGVNHAKNSSPEQIARNRAKAGLAQELMRNPAMRRALAASLGRAPDPLSATPTQKQMEKINRAINRAAVLGAQAYLDGQKGNKGTELLRSAHGAMTPEREEELLEGLMDSSLPHSAFNPNYGHYREACRGAGLPDNAATMAMAASQEGSRLRGQALGAAYNALASSLAPSLPAGLTPGSAGHTRALAEAIRTATPERQRAAAAVGIGLMGTGEAEQLTNDEWEAYVNWTEEQARNQGMRPDALMAAVRNAQAARPAEFGNNLPHGPQRAAALGQALGHLASGMTAMRGVGLRPELMGHENMAGQVYDLADSGRATPQRMQALKVAAEAKGVDTFTGDDIADVEALVDHGGYSLMDARNGLIHAQEIRAIQGGTATGGSAARGLPNKGLTQRVMMLGAGINAPSVELMSNSAWDGVGLGQVMVAGRNVMGQAMAAQSLSGSVQALSAVDQGNLYNYIHDPANHIDAELIGGYIDLASNNSEASGTYAIPVVRAAVGLANAGRFNGRVDRAVVALTSAMNSTAGMGAAMPIADAVAVVGAIDGHSHHMPPAGYGRADVIHTYQNFSNAQLNDNMLMEAAVHCLDFPTTSNSGGSYGEIAQRVSGYARTGNLRPSTIGPAHLVELDRLNELNDGSLTQDMVRYVISHTGGGGAGAGGTIRAQEVNMRVHREFASLPNQMFNQVLNMAEDMAVYEANLANVPAADIPFVVGNSLRTMSSDRRAVLLAIANGADVQGLETDPQALTQYVARVETIGQGLGFRDPVRTIDFVRRVTGNTTEAGLATVQERIEFLDSIGVSSERIQDPAVLNSLGALSGQYQGPTSQPDRHPYVARAVELYGGGVSDNAIGWLESMGGSGYDLGRINSPDVVRYQTVTASLGGGVAPNKQFVEKLVTAQVNLADANRVQIAHLPSIASLRPEDMNDACEAVIHYLAGTPPLPGQHKTCADLAALQQNPLFVDTLIAYERIHDAQQCGQYNATSGINPVERDYHENRNPPQNTGQYMVNVSGRQVRIGN